MHSYTLKFNEIGIGDLAQVGGKNSSLGEMFSNLSSKGIMVPDGFATTSFAFEDYLKKNSLPPKLKALMDQLDRPGYNNLNEIGEKARELILAGELQPELTTAVSKAYKELYGKEEIEVDYVSENTGAITRRRMKICPMQVLPASTRVI